MSSAWTCAHDETTEPDKDGYVICCACLSPLRRPLSPEQLTAKLEDPR